MSNMIERYIHEVTRRLPEADRADVRDELMSSIADMLPEYHTQDDIHEVLESLGNPAKLAEQYRVKPRYLISPAVYDDYIRALKWIIPIGVGVMVLVGLISGAIKSIEAFGTVPMRELISEAISRCISFAVSGAIYAVFWTTVGFVFADRRGKLNIEHKWTVSDLPESVPNSKGSIPLADGIIELVLTLVFSLIGLLIFTRTIPVAFSIFVDDTTITSILSDSFLQAGVYVCIIIALFAILESAAKLYYRRWTPLVCASVIAANIASIGTTIYMFTRPEILSPELSKHLQEAEWLQLDMFSFLGEHVEAPFLLIICVIVVIACIIESAQAVYNTIKARQ